MRAHLKVEGFEEFRRALKSVDTKWPKELRKGLNEVAEMVADEAATRVPERSGDLKRSIRARSTTKEGRTVMGSGKVPYAGWIDFGGTIRPRGREINRPFIKRGRYLFPSADDLAPQIRKKTAEVLNRFIDKAGLG